MSFEEIVDDGDDDDDDDDDGHTSITIAQLEHMVLR